MVWVRSQLAVLALTLAACGGSATLSDLRCDDPCQDFANPFLLHLQIDYDDPGSTLEGGQLQVKIDGQDHLKLPINDLATRPLPEQGTLRFEVPLDFPRLVDGRLFTVAVRAETFDGQRTNERTLPFRMRL